MNRKLRYDEIDFSPARITERDDPHFGVTTIFHDVVIAREIVQVYEDGKAYKPARELKDAAWTAEGRWIILGRHPDTAIISSRNDISGRTVNVRYTKSLIDPKTQRPNNHGLLADMEVFNSRVAPDVLMAMKSGTKRDVSIGFFFDEDGAPGTIEDDKHPLKGTAYDYVQRNIMIDHTAAALDTGSGRCTMPLCGIGADRFKTLVTGDPLDKCVASVMKENPSYSKEKAEAICYSQEKKSKDFIPIEEDKLSMNQFTEDLKTALQAILDSLPSLETAEDDLVSEEYQGNAGAETLSMRAKMHFSISEAEWDALSEEEKDDYIGKLPPEKTKAGGEEMSNRDCVYQWDEIREKLLQKLPDKTMAKSEPIMLSQILGEMKFDGDSVTITTETMGKLREYGIDLEPCECDDAESDEDEEDIVGEGEEAVVDDTAEPEADEAPVKVLRSTEQIVHDTEKVLQDIKRLVG